ncbi:MAG: PHP domain-containing protein, partial [Ignavibacteriaceae bacterium]|nr:PHP domain-containing protein [Ignavibacteriaceae bacterium]
MFVYSGALHIHSTFSDGTGTAGEIAEIASDSGVDFIILTDHNTLRAYDEGYEKFYGKTFLSVGYELNDKDNCNHYLVLDYNKTLSTRLSAKEYTRIIKEEGGTGILAHPHEKRNALPQYPPYPWVEWDTDDFQGIEIWNHMSVWMENLTAENKYNNFVHPLKSLTPPPDESLRFWDEVNQKRKVIGIGGLDAHAHKVSVFGMFMVEVFPYKVLFKSIRTNILLEEELKRINTPENIIAVKKTINNAIAAGRSYIANYYYGDAGGFRFFAIKGDKLYQMGDKIEEPGDVTLKLLIPSSNCLSKLIRNGVCIDETSSSTPEFKVNLPGVYRVEVSIYN